MIDRNPMQHIAQALDGTRSFDPRHPNPPTRPRERIAEALEQLVEVLGQIDEHLTDGLTHLADEIDHARRANQ